MNRIGIMQGRLVPPEINRIQHFPRQRWQDEFPFAARAGLQTIEWIYDEFGEGANPLETAEGIATLKALSAQHGVHIRSLCADYFMDKPFLRVSPEERKKSEEMLQWLLAQGRALAIQRMVVPFVDQAAIRTADEMDIVVAVLKNALPAAEKNNIELHLETALGPSEFAALLRRLPSPWIRVNYDSGNSASLGYRPDDEFAAYGDRVGSVHIKDRKWQGTTVPLTTGDTDFHALFRCLRALSYAGDCILQVARGEAGDEVAWARKNREFVEKNLFPQKSWI